MKLVALTLVLALGASSMAKSALNSSIPPTFHLGSSGGPVWGREEGLSSHAGSRDLLRWPSAAALR